MSKGSQSNLGCCSNIDKDCGVRAGVVRACLLVCVHACLRACVHACMRVCVSVHLSPCAHVCVCALFVSVHLSLCAHH